MNAPIFLPILIDSCSAETSAQLATGSTSECLEGLTNKLFLAKSAYRFPTLADFKDKTVWAAAILARDIVPLFSVYEVASENTEATRYETGNFVYTTKKEVKKMVSESYLSICSHRALKSYENSDYNQVFEATENREVLGVYDIDGVKIKGQDITDFDVAIRERPTNDKPAFSKTAITYRDFEEFEHNGIIAQMSWDPSTLNGIFGLQLQIVASSATEITFRAFGSCGSDTYDLLAQADLTVLTNTGAAQTLTGLSNANGIYVLQGTDLESGTISVDPVDKSGMVVSAEAVAFTI